MYTAVQIDDVFSLVCQWIGGGGEGGGVLFFLSSLPRHGIRDDLLSALLIFPSNSVGSFPLVSPVYT